MAEDKKVKKDVLVAVLTKKKDSDKEANCSVFKNKEGKDAGVSFSVMMKDRVDGNAVFAEIIDFNPKTIQKVNEGRFKAFDTLYAVGRFEEKEWEGNISHQFIVDNENTLSKVDNIYLLKNRQLSAPVDGKAQKTFTAVVGNFDRAASKVAATKNGGEMGIMQLVVAENKKDKEGKDVKDTLNVSVKFMDAENIAWLKKALEDEKLDGCEYAVKGNLQRDDKGNVSVWADARSRKAKDKDGNDILIGSFSIAHPIPAFVVAKDYPEYVPAAEEKKSKTAGKDR